MSVELDKNLPDTIRMSPRQYALTYAQTLRDFARAYYGCHWKARVSRPNLRSEHRYAASAVAATGQPTHAFIC